MWYGNDQLPFSILDGLAVVNGESSTCGRKETSCRLRKACDPPGPCTNMFDLRKKERKAARQAAQNTTCIGSVRSSCENIAFNKSIVVGSFGRWVSPMTRLQPISVDLTCQEVPRGLGSPASRCIMRITLIYCLILQ